MTTKAKPQQSLVPPSSAPTVANYSSEHLVIGGGVAIFHVASGRVVVVYDPNHDLWFLPKGRRDVHEVTERGAEREGFEESGYRNRLLPIPMTHRQPQPRMPGDPRLSRIATEPIWTQLMPAGPTTQYILYWYVAETLCPADEEFITEQESKIAPSIFGSPYVEPPPYPLTLKLKDRLAKEPKGYEPKRHEGTTNDPEEMLYESHLLSVPEAIEKLKASVSADVVRRGWAAIQSRLAMDL